MSTPAELDILRRGFARQVIFAGGVSDRGLEAAFAAVHREDFLGEGPWQIYRLGPAAGYAQTPDADPAWLYADVLVGIVPERGLNNGHPSSHAAWLDAAHPAEGDHVVHVGAGVGYYSAILAHMAGPRGALTAIEFDPDLARRAAANLTHLPKAAVINGDGSTADFPRLT